MFMPSHNDHNVDHKASDHGDMKGKEIEGKEKEDNLGPKIQKFTQRLTLKNAKKQWGHLAHVPSKPKLGKDVRIVCEFQPRGNLAKVNGLMGKIVRLTGTRWIEVDITIDGAIYTYRTTPNNLRYCM